jgi:biotin carboxyl carrier protein
METTPHTADPRDFTVAAPSERSSLSQSLDLRQLHQQIAEIIGAGKDAEQMAKDAVAFVARLTSSQLVVYFVADAVGGLSIGADHRVAVSDDVSKYWLELLAGQAAQCRVENRLQVTRLQQNRIAMAVPVQRPGAPAEALAAVFLLGAERPESFAVILQLMAGLLAAYHLQHENQAGEWEVAVACAILDLATSLGKATDVSDAGVLLVNSIKAFLGCQRVAIGFKKSHKAPCKLLAISGMSDLNLQAEMPKAVADALVEAVRGGDWTVWLADKKQAGPLLPAHARLGEVTGESIVCSAPLRAVEGEAVGAWVFWGVEGVEARTHAERFARVSAAPLGTALQLVRQGQVNPVRRLIRKWRLLERKSFWASVAVLALLCLSFWPYRITSDCAIEPLKKRFVAAPFAGVFEKSLVRPGDVIKADQTLARMDGRELRMELAGVVAESQRARKSRDVNVAAGKTAAAQIDALQMQIQEQKRRLLESRIENLDIKSPTAGIVVSGDLERSEGAPVTAGQALYEIAPLDQMIVEVAINDEDVANVDVGQKVAVKLDAYPGKVWKGTIEKIHPRSEIRDSKNVFIAEVSLGDDGDALRPGMKGTATVTTSAHNILWIGFHKAWYMAIKWLGM